METKIQSHSKTLSEDGFVVIKNHFDDDTCDGLYKRMSHSIEEGDFDMVGGDDHKYNYGDFVNWDGPVANKRTGRDDGMIDVFNVDTIAPDVNSFKTDETIYEIINGATSKKYSPDNVNVYWNRSVTTTRDFHADTYSGKFKSFLYLTSVPDTSYGPFSYIRGSHQSSRAKRKLSNIINRLKGNPSTDAVFNGEDDVTYCTAPKGTLIIANQSGYHKGHPQKEGRERMLITTSYTPE
jgi:hypothetical protein